MLYPLFETIDIHGSEHIINFNFIASIRHMCLQRSAVTHSATNSPCGPSGATAIQIVMSTGHSVTVACDWDEEDITEEFVRAYKDYFERIHKQASTAGR